MVQYSNRTKLSPVRKKWYNTQTVGKPANSQKNMVQYSEPRWYKTETGPKPVNRQKKDGTILKQCKNLSPARKKRYNTQTEPTPVSSQKKMVQYSNKAKTCRESKKDGAILK